MFVGLIGARDHADTTGVNATAWLYGGDCYRGKCNQGAEAPQLLPKVIGESHYKRLDGETHKRYAPKTGLS